MAAEATPLFFCPLILGVFTHNHPKFIMPTLTWIGKDKVINHHHDVPFRVLDSQYTFGTENSANRIIHGDNLEALKALLPYYEGLIKCIYIDPPYNTGNENWVYNDNVSDPKLKRWLGKVVGKESEDLSRHDKWLCMMYPRLQLLKQLLADDGVIFVSIDDNEVQNLRPILDDIFSSKNRIEQFIWKKSYGGGAKERYAVTVHEYVLMYAKDKDNIKELTLPPDPSSEARYYKLTDEKLSTRGPFRVKPLEATKSMDYRANLVYPIAAPDGTEVWPKRQWWWAKERSHAAVESNDLYFTKGKDNSWSISYKQYLRDSSGEERQSKPFSIIDGIYNQVGSAALRDLFSDRGQNIFQFPKPVSLIEKLLSMLQLSSNDIILDSFAGSGTTAHAVLNLNKQDGGNRQFILVEMEDYAETITAERVRRVIDGYGGKVGTGGGFTYYELGPALFTEDNLLNENLPLNRIREYVWYSETRLPFSGNDVPEAETPYFLGKHYETAYYFYYEPDQLTTLDYDFLSTLQTPAEQYVIYADNCLIGRDWLQQRHLIFKKIPRDISRF